MTKRECPYTYPHKSRAAKVAYITSIGGYYADRHARFPVEFTVGTHYADLGFDSLWPRVLETAGVQPGTRESSLLQFCAKRAYKEIEGHLWSWAQEDIARSLQEADTYRMLWGGDTTLDVKLDLYGRGGKHLVIEEFEGVSLQGKSEEDLQELLMEQTPPYGAGRCDKDRLLKDHEWTVKTERLDTLYRYIRQCEIDFTSRKASDELEYAAAFILHSRAEDLQNLLLSPTPELALKDAAEKVFQALDASSSEQVEAFRVLCSAAGIDITSITE